MKKFLYNTIHLKGGFTLVETLVAIAVLLVAIVGPMTIAAQGLQASFFSREQTTAVYLAQEAIEAIEKKRDDQALNDVAIKGDRVWQLCQNGVLPADPGDPIVEQNPDAGYTDPDICKGDTWGWYDELTADDGPDCDASTDDSIGCDYDGASGTFHVCTSDADCTLQADEAYTSGRYYQYDNGSPSQFTRTITLSNEGDDEALVTVEVRWRASLFGGTDSRVVLQTRIFDQYE